MNKIFFILLVFATWTLLYVQSPSHLMPSTNAVAIVAAMTSGILNPPGYPLFGIFADLFRLVSQTSSPTVFNLISVFSGGLYIGLFYLITQSLGEALKTPRSLNHIVAFLAAVFLSFTPIFTSQFTLAEKYPFMFLTALLLIYFLLEGSQRRPKSPVIIALICGLAICAHYTLIPLAVVTLVQCFRWSRPKPMAFIFSFILGLTPFLYLVIKAQTAQLMNWENPHNLENFLSMILRNQYGGLFVERTWAIWLEQWQNQYQILIQQLTWPGLALGFLGLILTFLRNKKVGFAYLALIFYFGEAITYFVQFHQPSRFDIHNNIFLRMMWPFYFLYTTLLVLMAASPLLFLLQKMKYPSKLITSGIAGILVIGFSLQRSLPLSAPSDILGEYIQNYEAAVPQAEDKALLVTNIDTFFFALTETQLEKNWRPNTTVIHTELMRAAWYITHLKTMYSEFYQRNKDTIDSYEQSLISYENGHLAGDDMNMQYLKVFEKLSMREESQFSRNFIISNPLISNWYEGLLANGVREPYVFGDRYYASAGEVNSHNYYDNLQFEDILADGKSPDFAWQKAILFHYHRQLDKRNQIATIFKEEEELLKIKSLLKVLEKPEAP